MDRKRVKFVMDMCAKNTMKTLEAWFQVEKYSKAITDNTALSQPLRANRGDKSFVYTNMFDAKKNKEAQDWLKNQDVS